MRRLSITATMLALIVATGCGTSSTASSGPSSAPTAAGTSATGAASTPPQTISAARAAPQIADLNDIGQLRTLFNAHAGEPRLIILMSPT